MQKDKSTKNEKNKQIKHYTIVQALTAGNKKNG